MNILIVEDSTFKYEIIAKELKKKNINFDLATTYYQAIEMLKNNTYEGVILDLGFANYIDWKNEPIDYDKYKGIKLCSEINKEYSDIQVLFFSTTVISVELKRQVMYFDQIDLNIDSNILEAFLEICIKK